MTSKIKIICITLFSLCIGLLESQPESAGFQTFASGSGLWSKWTAWSVCTKSTICNSGTRERKRYCGRHQRSSMVSDDTFCVGPYDEQEDCPKSKCTHSKPIVYLDVTEAATSSFISQECDTDAKFAVAGEHANLIPPEALFIVKQTLGTFSKDTSISRNYRQNSFACRYMTKICFEPRGLRVSDVSKINRFNRVVRATLNSDGVRMHHYDSVAGMAIVINDKNRKLHALYFAVPSEKFGFKKLVIVDGKELES